MGVVVAVGSGSGVLVGAGVGVGVGGTGVAVNVAVGITTTTVFVGALGASPAVAGATAAPGGVGVNVGKGVRVGLSPWLQPAHTTRSSVDVNSLCQNLLCRFIPSPSQRHLRWLCGLPNVIPPFARLRVEIASILADLVRFCKETRFTLCDCDSTEIAHLSCF